MFEPRVALSSISGRSDAEWARSGAPWAGLAIMGGLALDSPTREAARAMSERDREEFLPTEPLEFLDSQLRQVRNFPIRPGINVRAVQTDSLRDAAARAAIHDAVFEINAHCRQREMTEIGAGQALAHQPDRLADQVSIAAETGATVSVKVRAEVPGVSLPALADRLADAGADMLHVDAMDDEPVIGEIADRADVFLVANNGVRDRETVRAYLQHGADAVSVGRPSDDPAVLERVHAAIQASAPPGNEWL